MIVAALSFSCAANPADDKTKATVGNAAQESSSPKTGGNGNTRDHAGKLEGGICRLQSHEEPQRIVQAV